MCGDLQIWYAGMGGKGILADEPLDLPNKLLARPCMNLNLNFNLNLAAVLQPLRVMLSGRPAAALGTQLCATSAHVCRFRVSGCTC